MRSPPRSEPDSRWGGPATVLALVLAGAGALRLVGLDYGLPYGGLLSPEEREAVPRAFAMVHGAGPDPHPDFDRPSLFLYLLAPFQWWQEEPSYYAARLVAVAVGLAGVAAAWWLGSRAYGALAGGVAAVATGVAGVHVAASRVALADVLVATLVTVALALAVSGRLELAAVAAGLALAAGWPGAAALVPVVVLAWRRRRRLVLVLALAAAAFAAGSPFALVHAGEAAGDVVRAVAGLRTPALGYEDGGFAGIAFAGTLFSALGPALAVAAAGLAAALVVRNAADRVLLSFAFAYAAPLLLVASPHDRYVLPLVPVLGALAGRVTAVAPVTLLLLIVPFTWTVRETEELTKEDTRVAALPRVERLVGDLPLTIDHGLPPPDVPNLRVVGPPEPGAQGPGPSLRPGYVWVNGDVADRVRAAPGSYPGHLAYYKALEREGERVLEVAPGDDLTGPRLVLYRLPSSG